MQRGPGQILSVKARARVRAAFSRLYGAGEREAWPEHEYMPRERSYYRRVAV